MNRIVDTVKRFKGSEATDTTIVLISNAASQFINFIAVMLITRALTVEDYSKFAMLNTIMSLVIDLADMGMNGAVTRFVAQYHDNDKKSEFSIIAYAIKRKLINSAFVIGIMLVLSKIIAVYFVHDSGYQVYVILTAFCVGFSLLSSMNKAIFQGQQKFIHYFISVITDTGVYILFIAILFFIKKLCVPSIIMATMVKTIISIIVSARLAGIRVSEVIKNIHGDKDAVKKFNIFGNWMLLWAIFANLQSRADIILLSQLTTSDQVSYYDIANKFTKPFLMIISSYAQVLNPLLVTMNEKNRLKEKLLKIAKVISVVTVGLAIGCLLSGSLVHLLFGDKYISSIAPLRIMLLSLIFYVWTVPFNSALYALNKPHIFAIAAGIGLVATIIGDFIFLGRFGAVGASYTYCLAQIISLIVAVTAYIREKEK